MITTRSFLKSVLLVGVAPQILVPILKDRTIWKPSIEKFNRLPNYLTKFEIIIPDELNPLYTEFYRNYLRLVPLSESN